MCHIQRLDTKRDPNAGGKRLPDSITALHPQLKHHPGLSVFTGHSARLCCFFSQQQTALVLSLHPYAGAPSSTAFHPCARLCLCSAINLEATGLQWAAGDLRILQVAGREGGSPLHQIYTWGLRVQPRVYNPLPVCHASLRALWAHPKPNRRYARRPDYTDKVTKYPYPLIGPWGYSVNYVM